MKLQKALIALCMLSIVVTGCATYTPSLARLDATVAGASKQTTRGVTVYVDEHISKAKSERVFDTDLREDGVVALLVTVQNSNVQALSLKAMDYQLRDGSNTLRLLSPEEAAERAKKSAAARAIGWSLIVPIISIPIAATASVMHTNKVNRQMREDFISKNLGTVALTQGKDSSGFLFFEADKGRGDFSNLVLELKGQLEGNADPIVVATALPPVTVKPADPQVNAPASPK